MYACWPFWEEITIGKNTRSSSTTLRSFGGCIDNILNYNLIIRHKITCNINSKFLFIEMFMFYTPSLSSKRAKTLNTPAQALEGKIIHCLQKGNRIPRLHCISELLRLKRQPAPACPVHSQPSPSTFIEDFQSPPFSHVYYGGLAKHQKHGTCGERNFLPD